MFSRTKRTNHTHKFYDKYEDTEEFDIIGYDINIIDQSDFIMFKTNRGKRIWFDVSEVPLGQHIISTLLKLYQSVGDSKTYTVAVYRVADIKSDKRIKEYINSANTTTDKKGWITVNIHQALEYCVKRDPRENRGLFIAVHDVDYVDHIRLRPDDIAIVSVSEVPEKQPFTVGFFRNSGKRNKHDTLQTETRDRPKELGFSSINIPNNPYIGFKNPRKGNSCNIESFIIAMEGYDAFYCSGECNFSISMNLYIISYVMSERKFLQFLLF